MADYRDPETKHDKSKCKRCNRRRSVFTDLMGEKWVRKIYIQEHAREVRNLDI